MSAISMILLVLVAFLAVWVWLSMDEFQFHQPLVALYFDRFSDR